MFIIIFIYVIYLQMSFNSHRDALVPFTRDFDSIKVAIMNIEYYDRSRIKNGLEGVQSLIMEEWGAGVPCQVSFYLYSKLEEDNLKTFIIV